MAKKSVISEPVSGKSPKVHRTQRTRPRLLKPIGLRSRILITFGLGSFALSLFLALATYNFTRSNLVEDREKNVIEQAYENAAQLAIDLRSNPSNTQTVIERLTANRPLLYFRGTWTGDNARFSSNVIDRDMLVATIDNREPRTMRIEVDKELVLAIGIPLDSADAAYFEFPSMQDVRSTLNSINLALTLAAIITTLLGIFLGAIVPSLPYTPYPLPSPLQATHNVSAVLLIVSVSEGLRDLEGGPVEALPLATVVL